MERERERESERERETDRQTGVRRGTKVWVVKASQTEREK